MGNPSSGICVFSEKQNVTLELLSKARQLADSNGTWAGVAYVSASPPDSKMYGDHGADKVFATVSQQFSPLNPDTAVQALYQIVNSASPILLMVGATKEGREVGARLAQRFNAGYSSECLDLRIDDGTVYADRATIAGTYLAQQRLLGQPAVVSIPPRRFQASTQSPKSAHTVEIKVEPAAPRCQLIEVRSREGSSGDVELEKADTIVAVGRGLKRKEDLAMIEELAKAIGGEVGSSRPLSEDLKWLPESRQVGLSGHKVQPKLYIACGISGQMQHIAGMLNSKIVVAINPDAKAPIFEQSDYGVVVDMYKFLPALTASVQRLKQKTR